MMSSAAALAAVIADNYLFSGGGRGRIVARSTRDRGNDRPHQGKQEVARRLRQIERGQLTLSNGLML